MAIGTSLILMAAGAILAFAVSFHVAGVDIQTIGYILLAVGFVGLIITLVLMSQARGTTPADPRDPRYPDGY